MRKAFTLIELIVVILVIMLINHSIMPKIERNFKEELKDTVLADIEHARTLATSDFKQKNDDPQWQRTLWSISFGKCVDGGIYTSIGSDINKNGVLDENETVLDPMTNKYMYANKSLSCKNGGGNNSSDRIFLTDKYDVKAIRLQGGCLNAPAIGFDTYGRPHTWFHNSTNPNYNTVMSYPCLINFYFNNGDIAQIKISPETGYVEAI